MLIFPGGLKLNRNILCLVLIAGLICGVLSGCTPERAAAVPEAPKPSVQSAEPLPQVQSLSEPVNDYGLAVAVLYDGGSASVRWQDTVELLEQSTAIGLTVEAVDAAAPFELSRFDLVIPDGELASGGSAERLADALIAFTEQGGYVLLDNAFSQVLPLSYLGISETRRLEGCPTDLTCPQLGADLGAIQEVISDYVRLYPDFHEAQTLQERDYGFGFLPDTAVTLAAQGDQALYTYHAFGAGGVLLTNPILPNIYSLGNFSMTHRAEGETAFANTTASCNQLLYGRFAAYVAKQKYGYALNRVFGFNGSPSMAWELHYEEITAYANNSMKLFDDLCREYQQIPSYSIIRSTYWWFLRTETVTYLRNQSAEGFAFAMDYEESAYSSGTHIASGGEWLHINSIENAGSYFKDYPEYNDRAYPCFADFDGDGADELICGSADGYFYVYDELSYSDRLHTSAAKRLTDAGGYPIRVAGFSAPQMIDLDGDGVTDLISGGSGGTVVWYRGIGGGCFAYAGILAELGITGQALPALGDVNGDGVTDLAVGSDAGILLLYYGSMDGARLTFRWQRMESYSKLCANAGLGTWLAPTCIDWNADGSADLLLGTFEGYIAVLSGDGQGRMRFDGWVDIEEWNYRGNCHVKFGSYCVPCFYDVDADGNPDLTCGSLEYGLAYPIDSPYFPYRAELQAQFDYAERNHLYVGVHHYTNGFASAQREAYELRRHKEAFASYGAETEGVGTNSHTWYSSIFGDTQTFDAEFGAGLLWNSGFSAPGDPDVAPQYAAENVIALPFFLRENGKNTLLVQNCAVLPYEEKGWSDISAKYGMPVCVYYHCDFVYESDAGARDYLQKLSDFRAKYGYNFMREDQLMQASAAAYNLAVQVRNENGTLTLTPAELSRDGTLYDPVSQSAVGVEIAFAENRDASAYGTDAEVFRRSGNSLFVRLNKPVHVSTEPVASTRLEQVNLPCEIRLLDNGADITFLSDGMMQVDVRGSAETSSVGWTVTRRDGKTVFTKYGSEDTLQIRYVKE